MRQLEDRVELAALSARDERDRAAVPPHAAGPADAVHVDLGLVGQFVVDDVRHVGDVEPPRRDVGGHEQRHPTGPEGDHHGVALRLAEVPVQRADAVVAAQQVVGQSLGADLRAGEDDRARRPLGPQDAVEGIELLARLDLHQPLLDPLHGGRLGRHPDDPRAVQLFLGELPDRGRHRGRKERRLSPVRRSPQDVAHVVDEAHREHLVGLVEHDHPGVAEQELAAPQQVEHAPGRADHDLRAAGDAVDLLADRGAAVDGHDVDALEVGREGAARVGDLQRQLARRAEHDRLDVPARGVDPLQDREHEGGRLARARLGLADDVAVAEQVLDRALLDRGRRLVAEVLERTQERRGQVEVTEAHVVGHPLSS